MNQDQAEASAGHSDGDTVSVDNHYQPKRNFVAPEETEAHSTLPSALTSEEFTGLRVGHVKSAAGGVPAVLSSMLHLQKETGLARGMKIMARINQKGGFDCPGCAWPDPDDHRAATEFC